MSKKKKALIILGALVVLWVVAQPVLNDIAVYDEGLTHAPENGRLEVLPPGGYHQGILCAEAGGSLHNGRCE